MRLPSGPRVLALHLDSDDPGLKALRDPECLLAKARAQPLLADVLARAMPASVHARPAGSARLDFEAMSAAAAGFFAIGDAMLSFDSIASPRRAFVTLLQPLIERSIKVSSTSMRWRCGVVMA